MRKRKQGKTNNSKTSNGADFIIEHADIKVSFKYEINYRR